jgi:ATP-dependent protease ClpP protease subunit
MAMLKKYYVLVSFSLLLHTSCSLSKDSDEDSTLTISGDMTLEKYQSLDIKIAQKKIKTIIFKNCIGGNSLAGLRLAQTIQTNNIKTIASGPVISACAFAYLGGSVRHIDTLARDNLVLLHGAFDVTSGLPVGITKNQDYLAIYARLIGFEFKKTTRDIILNTKKRYEGIYFVRTTMEDKYQDLIMYCNGDSEPDSKKCQKLEGITFESEGITTK